MRGMTGSGIGLLRVDKSPDRMVRMLPPRLGLVGDSHSRESKEGPPGFQQGSNGPGNGNQ